MKSVSLLDAYDGWKELLVVQAGMSDGLLHLYAGMLVFALTSLILHQRLASPVPLLAVFLFAIADQLADTLGPWPESPTRAVENLFHTVLMPSILFLLARNFERRAW